MSKFKGLLDVARDRTPDPELEATAPPPAAGQVRVIDPTPRRGRPPGKRSSGEYTQVTAYIRTETHRKAKRALLDDGRDFSDIVEQLVNEWLEART